jgi:hypothetical protein
MCEQCFKEYTLKRTGSAPTAAPAIDKTA